MIRKSIVALAGSALLVASATALGWAETDDDDLIIDAPWRSMRNYVPVLFFAPELEGYSVIQRVGIYNWDVQTGTKKGLIFRDINPARVGGTKNKPLRLQDNSISQQYPFRKSCQNIPIQVIDPNGQVRGPLGLQEKFNNFWHYIVRVPTACIGNGAARGTRGVHYLRAEFQVDQMEEKARPKTISKVLRVAIDNRPLPKFKAVDRHYDVHIHTIAEQTGRDILNTDSARKVFGGPIAMVLESAYSLGLVDTKLHNANWSDFKDIIATTDHNTFFSAGKFDDGSKPGYGPTSNVANGALAEFAWYRANFGQLGAEEIAVAGSGNANGDRLSNHYLMYGAPHISGPWHGGDLDKITLTNIPVPGGGTLPLGITLPRGASSPATLDHIHTQAAKTNGFGYAAHPYSEFIGWPDHVTRDAIGWNKNIARLNADKSDFIFKGLQIWNGISDFVTKQELQAKAQGKTVPWAKNFPYAVNDDLNPFMTGADRQVVNRERARNGCVKNIDDVSTSQKFIEFRNDCYPQNNIPDHLEKFEEGLKRYYDFLGPLLRYSFKQGSGAKEHFIRKLYIAAATDAHGDFNYSTGSLAAFFAELELERWEEVKDKVGLDETDGTIINMSEIGSSAFGRVRTYMLTSERLNQSHVASLPQEGAISPTSRGIARAQLKPPSKTKTSVYSLRKPKLPAENTPQAKRDSKLSPQSTMTLASVQADPSRLASVEAYRDGNMILTDNPICKFSIDANCRLDSGTANATWHDRQCVFEDADGQIGGDGKFDGGRTALVVRDQGDVWINTIWDDLPAYHPNRPIPSSIDYDLVQIRSQTPVRNHKHLASGPRRADKQSALGIDLSDTGNLTPSANLPQALLLKGKTQSGNCVTNPIWVAPVELEIQHPPAGCPIAANELQVTLVFPMSMDSTVTTGGSFAAPTSGGPIARTGSDADIEVGPVPVAQPYKGIRVLAQPLDANGISSGEAIELKGEREWLDHYKKVSASTGFTVKNARYRIRNDAPIPCAKEGWDARRHAPANDVVSYAIIARDVRDLHGNALNEIGKTITVGTDIAPPKTFRMQPAITTKPPKKRPPTRK